MYVSIFPRFPETTALSRRENNEAIHPSCGTLYPNGAPATVDLVAIRPLYAALHLFNVSKLQGSEIKD